VRVGLLHFRPSSLHVHSIVCPHCKYLLCSKVIDDCLQLICNVETGVSVVTCVCALVEYWLRGGDYVVNYSLPTNIQPPIRDDCNIQSAYSMICLTLTWTLLNSAFSKLVDKACLVGGVYAGQRTFINLFQHTLPVSIRGEPVAYTAQARHSSAFLWLRSSIESKKLRIPGGPWAFAIDKVSDSSFSPWIEVEGLLSEVAYCER
jgi:hypothetical protein